MTDAIIDSLKELTIKEDSLNKKEYSDKKEESLEEKEDFTNILYYSIQLSEESELEIKNNNEIFKHIDSIKDIQINKNFHITALFTGGKFNNNAEKFNDFFNKNIKIEIKSYAVSNDFIVLSVDYISTILNDDKSNDIKMNDIPYFGNPIKHITYGVKKGCKPVNSPSAFKNGITYQFEKPLLLNGILEIVKKNK
jgi:hypothetical protein